jgi:hypothetical protein
MLTNLALAFAFATFLAFVLVFAPLLFCLVAALLVASLFYLIGFFSLLNVIDLAACHHGYRGRRLWPFLWERQQKHWPRISFHTKIIWLGGLLACA